MSNTESSTNTKRPAPAAPESMSHLNLAGYAAAMHNTVNNNRLSVLSNTSASVRQKSFDSPRFAYAGANNSNSQLDLRLLAIQNNSQPSRTNPQYASGSNPRLVVNDDVSSDNGSLYTAFESNSLLRRNSSIKKASKNPLRDSLYPLTRRTSILQKYPKGHKHYIRSINNTAPHSGKPNPLFQKQNKYRLMMFRTTKNKKNINATYTSRDQLYGKVDTMFSSGFIKYDIVPPTLLRFGYNFSQDSLHRYYGVAPPARQASVKRAGTRKINGIGRTATTKKKPKFVFGKFKQKPKQLTREERKQLLKSQITKLSNEDISISSRYQNFIDLSKNKLRGSKESSPKHHSRQPSGRSNKEIEKIVDDNSSSYSVQLITNSKVVKSPSLNGDRKRTKRKNVGNRNIFFQLLLLNPELKSQIKCTDLDAHSNLVLRTPSLEYETYAANGLNYGFNKRNSHRMSTYNNVILKNAIGPDAIVNRNSKLIKSQEVLRETGETSSDSHGKDDSTKGAEQTIVPETIASHVIPRKRVSQNSPPRLYHPADNSNIVQQKILSPSKVPVNYDSPITYDFSKSGVNKLMKPNFARGKFSVRDELDSATSTNFPHRDFVRQSVVSSSSIGEERYYTPPLNVATLEKVSDASLATHNSPSKISVASDDHIVQDKSVSPSELSAADLHNARVRQQRMAQTQPRKVSGGSSKIHRNHALGSLEGTPMDTNNTRNMSTFSSIDAQDLNRDSPLSIRSSTSNVKAIQSNISNNYLPDVELVPVGIAKQFDITKKDKKKRKSAHKNELNNQLRNVQKIERQSLLEHANSMKKRKSRLVLGALFSGGKVGLKPNSKRSSLISAKTKRQSLTSTKSYNPAVSVASAVAGEGLHSVASAGLGITSSSKQSSNETSKEKKDTSKDPLVLSPPHFGEFIDNQDRLIGDIVNNSSISLATKKSELESPIKSQHDSKNQNSDNNSTLKAKPEEFHMRITNISAEEYKRYSDLYEQNKDKIINPDYVISDNDEAELQRELDSFNPVLIQKMIQQKLAADNGLKSAGSSQRPSSVSSSSSSSKEKFYNRRHQMDNAKLAASQGAISSDSLQEPRSESQQPLSFDEPSRPPFTGNESHSSESQKSSLPSPALNLKTPSSFHPPLFHSDHTYVGNNPYPVITTTNASEVAAIPVTASFIERGTFKESIAQSAGPFRHESSASNQTSQTESSSNGGTGSETYSSSGNTSSGNNSSGNSTNEPQGQQTYEVWGQYMKRIVDQRIKYRLQNSLLGPVQPIAESPDETKLTGTSATLQEAASEHSETSPLINDRKLSESSRNSFVTANSEVGSLLQETISRSTNNLRGGSNPRLPINHGNVFAESESPSGMGRNVSDTSDTMSPDFRRTPYTYYGFRQPSPYSDSHHGFQTKNSSSSSSSGSRGPTPRLGIENQYHNTNNLSAISESQYRAAHSNGNSPRGYPVGSGSERSHSSKSKRSNDSVSVKSVIGNKEITVSLTKNNHSPLSNSATMVGKNYTLGDLSHSSVNLTFRNVASPKGSIVSKDGSMRSKSSYRSTKSSSSSLLLRTN